MIKDACKIDCKKWSCTQYVKMLALVIASEECALLPSLQVASATQRGSAAKASNKKDKRR
jgi:hypothetical protein